MLPLTDATIRASFVNASLRERKNLSLPTDFDELDWDSLDFLGWRDRKYTNLGYVVVDLDGTPTGILLRQADAAHRARPQCSWCEDVHLPNDVVFFSARRSGAAGRNGDTVGTLACAKFECSTNVRRLPPVAYVGFDVEAARIERIEALREHVTAFARRVLAGEER
ncbi:FBP domain-containing protein [Humibacter soli]